MFYCISIPSFGDRANEYDVVAQYFRTHFLQIHRKNNESRRTLYTHFTSVVNTKTTQTIITSGKCHSYIGLYSSDPSIHHLSRGCNFQKHSASHSSRVKVLVGLTSWLHCSCHSHSIPTHKPIKSNLMLLLFARNPHHAILPDHYLGFLRISIYRFNQSISVYWTPWQ